MFLSTRGGGNDIWVVRGDGAFPTQLTRDGAFKNWADVSLDGRRIVYPSDPDGDGAMDAFMLNIDGSGLTQLTNAASLGQSVVNAVWCPNCRDVLFTDRTSNRIFAINADNPPSSGGPQPRPLEPQAPTTTQPNGAYQDWVCSVGSGTMIKLDPLNDQFVSVADILLDNHNHVMMYVQGDACYQCGIPSTCGFPNFPVTVRLSRNLEDHIQIKQSPQYLEPATFGRYWTGETSLLEFALGDTRRDDNCGIHTVWLIPYPTW